ncbi:MULTISPECIES: DMT family transporter [Alphaproteobacteria]|uniref:Membrane protein n=2 Tax=Alphaproteobacteria TaxID=28211 RepID=A0A512HCD7_9HYPH|nr:MULTISPECIES: DMT family transporter [Alphaproteobacteria]GEO83107.1 membrane protein [Ciceribacter naphthalenivorans]GLR20497.1 membrane protein [Ciceribacter naphthalenivorans]GLT03353.1 membrane protein [Sphingomonas psychrolutea]
MALSKNTTGALLMALAMAGFTFNDALTKGVTPLMNVGQLMFVRGAITTILVYGVARHMGAIGHIRMLTQPTVLLRMLFETLAAVTFLNALGVMPLANISSILQSLPLAVTLGAALFLGEPVGWRRWMAIGIGFLGVLIIIRPGPEGFTMASLYVSLSVLFAAARDLVTKRIDPGISSLTVTLSTAVGITIVGGCLIGPLGGWQPMSVSTWGILLLASCLISIGYLAIIMAMRTGEISFIAPFRYTSLLWAVTLGMIFFGEVPDMWMATGTVIVIGSGLYAFYRENKRRSEMASRQVPSSETAA